MRAVRGGRGATGPHAASRLAVDRAREGRREAADRGLLDQVAAEVAPRWRLRGCHAGRREVDDDAGRNGRRTTAASGGANHGDTGEGEHTGMLHRTRGNEPTARICWRELDGGGLRRRQPAVGEGGNGDEVTRGRFPAVRESTRLREPMASVGLGEATPSKAGDKRVLRSTDGAGGEHTASGGNVTMGRRHRSDLSGLGPGERKKTSARSPLPHPNAHQLLRHTRRRRPARETAMARARNGEDWEGKEEGRRLGNRPWAVKGASWLSALAAKTATGGGEDDAGGRGKGKKGGEKEGLPPCRFGEKEEGERATRQRGGVLPPSLGGTRGERRDRVDDDGDDGGAVWSGAATRAADAGQARQALTAVATGRSATTARARAGGAAIWAASAGTAARAEREEGSARLTGRAGRERERESRGGRGRWAERDSAHQTRGRRIRLLRRD
uniref:DUF591 domain-containing protein n=1 Tax=Oryza sativa subsp. japonica TaxID=39947 RepID=Q94GK1_ORYSJ|nr:hypothetical protein [Oryza sativa Japonica Group]